MRSAEPQVLTKQKKNNGVITPKGVDPSAVLSTDGQTASDTEPTVTPTETPAPTETPEEVKESTYQFVIMDCTWSQAQAKCAEMGGHLVHFDSEGEFDKILALMTEQGIADTGKFWIGGTRDTASGSSEYHWVNADGTFKEGTINGDIHWMTGEPSFRDESLGVDEDRMMLYKLRNTTGQWVFNDAPDNILQYLPSYSGTVGFICEFGN